jgi:hypothetical protein
MTPDMFLIARGVKIPFSASKLGAGGPLCKGFESGHGG